MKANSDKSAANDNKALAEGLSEPRTNDDSTFQLSDNRSEATKHKSLQRIIDSHASQQLQPIQKVARRGASYQRDANLNVYNLAGDQVGHLIPQAEFDFDTDETALGTGNIAHQVTNMNQADYDEAEAVEGNMYVLSAEVISRQGMDTYAQEFAAQTENARESTTRLRAGRDMSKHAVSYMDLQNQVDIAGACFNFAVGSFNALDAEKQLQASVPEYVSHRYGALTGVVQSQADAIQATTSGTISAERAAAIDGLMAAAGMNIDVAGPANPDWFGGAAGAQRVNLKMPLQHFILRESGLRPNPEGSWAVGFRGNPTDLGSDHAWVQAMNPENNALYMTFDTFPDEESIIASRKRHSDPWEDEGDAVDFIIRITGPTAPQWALIEQIPDVEFDAALDNGQPSANRDLHPDDVDSDSDSDSDDD